MLRFFIRDSQGEFLCMDYLIGQRTRLSGLKIIELLIYDKKSTSPRRKRFINQKTIT